MSTPNLVFGVTPGKYVKEGNSPAPTTAQVAVWNEYGTENIPSRPAFRAGLDHALRVNKKAMGAQLKNISQRILSGRTAEIERSLTVLLTQIGKSAKAETKQLIKSGGQAPPNAPATVTKKGFNHPLYETGLLLDSVEYEVK